MAATGEGAALARMLRELKERSGFSYGVLARRLHVSTSTLHRYCNGDAVPLDHAPLERLARVCGASPAEQVELRRLWVLADARRAAGVVRSDPEPAAAADTGDVGDAEAERAAPAETAAASDPSSPTDSPTANDPAPSAGSPSRPPSSPAPRSSAEDVSRPSRTLGPAKAAAGPVPRSRSRRWGVVLAAAVVTLAVAGGAVLVQSLAGTDDRRDASHAGAGATAGERTPDGDGPTSGSPSASGKGKPQSTRAGSAEATEGDGKGRPAASQDSGPAVPLTVGVRPHTWEGPCSQHYLVDREPNNVPPPPTEQDAAGWVSAMGAVSSGAQMLTLTVQGLGEETVVLEGLHVRVQSTGAPLAWTDYVMGVGCGGDVSTKSFAVDLDASRPAAQPKAGQRDFPYKVSESDPEVFYVQADAVAHDVRWYLELEWSSGKRRGTVRVDDQGAPFRTSAGVNRPSYDYPLGGSSWREAPVDTP